MPANIIMAYDLQDLEKPLIPPRSRLYHLEPIGIGTPYVESLTSYINRLACAHCALPGKLIAQEVQPLLRGSTSMVEDKGFRGSESIAQLNGMTPLVREWVRVLEQLTGREELQFLTMLVWADIADQKGLVRRTRAWCAACYDEWLQTGQEIYEPLLWNVKAVTRCPLHHQDLLDRCPRQGCQQPIPIFTSLSSPSHCPKCGSSLAMSASRVTMIASLTDKPGQDIQGWNANATAALLSAAPLLSTIPSRDRVSAGITAYISHTVSGSDDVLARKLGVSKQQLMDWQRGLHLPRFSTLLTMCFHMNVSPLLFLTGDVESFFLTQSPVQVNSILKASQASGPVNKETLRKVLTEILREEGGSVLSLRTIARKLGYPVTTLRHYFPEQCQAIVERFQQRKNADYRQALEAFLIDNEHPTLNEVARRLGCPVTTLKYRYPELCRAITRQNQRVLDIGKIHEALLEALRCEDGPFPTVTEISKRFECSPSVLYHHFSDLCQELTKKHKNNRPGVSSLEKKDLNIGETEAITGKPKRSRKNLSVEDIDRMRQGLESLLRNDIDRPLTMTELANRFGCSRRTLRVYFPDLCDKLMKKREREEYVNGLRRALEKVLIDDSSPAPSVDQLARKLGCSNAVLRYHFPDLCRLISQRYMGLTDVEAQRNALEEIMRRGEETNLSINEIARRLGCANSTLYSRFPEQCKTVVKKRWRADNIDGMREVLEAALVNNEEPPPTLKALSELLGCPAKNLDYYFPEMCRAIAERRRRQLGLGRFRSQLEEMLAGDEPLSVREAARRLGCSDSSLRNCFPELCKSISARYLAYSRNKRLETIEQVCNEVREIVFDLHARGEYPAQDKVQGLVSKPGHFWHLKVRETWRNAIRELGLSN
jgi:AcrR family transcriptional regulator